MYARDVSTGADCALEMLLSSSDESDGEYVESDDDEESELLAAEGEVERPRIGGRRTLPLCRHGCRRPILMALFISMIHLS